MDRERFPTTATYLDSLPAGVDSYPDYLAKASLYRRSIEGRPLPAASGSLPPSLLEMLERPAPVSAWVSEVRTRALMHAIYDEHFRDRDKFLAWVYERNAAMFASPLYRALMMVVSPGVALRGAEMRWATFHRGVRIKVAAESKHASVRLSFPMGLFDELDVYAHGEAFRSAIDAAGARRTVLSVEFDRQSALYRGEWS
jgi:hypothetical protein